MASQSDDLAGTKGNEGTLASNLGKRLAELRKNSGMTQASLAAKVGVEPETISRIERGTVIPSIARLAELSAALGVEAHEPLMFHKEKSSSELAMAKLAALLRDRPIQEVDAATEIVRKILTTWG